MDRHVRRRLALLPALLLLIGAVSACSDDDPGSQDGSDNPFGLTDEQRAKTKDDLAPCTTTPTQTDGLTDPGQVLCFGTTANLPLGGASSEVYTGSMQLTVTGIERGDDALIDETITPGYSEWTSESRDLWFFRATAELVDEDPSGDLQNEDPIGFSGNLFAVDGASADSGIVGSLDGCDTLRFEDGAGEPIQTCDWGLLPPDVEAWSVRWFDTDDYFLDQIVWAAE